MYVHLFLIGIWRTEDNNKINSVYALACRFCIIRKSETGWRWVVHLQVDMHTVAAEHGCIKALVGTWWANSRLGCMNGLRNATLTL